VEGRHGCCLFVLPYCWRGRSSLALLLWVKKGGNRHERRTALEIQLITYYASTKVQSCSKHDLRKAGHETRCRMQWKTTELPCCYGDTKQ
jgi:hypothetical protein